MIKMNSASIKTPVQVSSLPIRLGQFLKLANAVQDGIEAKIRIQNREVLVNGETETRRGRQLQDGDSVTINQQVFLVSL